MIKSILYVALGGAAGSVLRFLISHFSARYVHGVFPWATFFTNLTGCLAMGLVIGALPSSLSNQHPTRLLLMTGFCGGYTTFSAFAAENLRLLQQQHYLQLSVYAGASLIFGIMAVAFGIFLSSK